jgi:hypothetical protein
VVAERVRVRVLEWGDERAARALATDLTLHGRGFALILGADVLYSDAACPLLFATLAAALAEGGMVVLCHQTRRVSDETEVDAAAKVELNGTRCRPGWQRQRRHTAWETSACCGCCVLSVKLEALKKSVC